MKSLPYLKQENNKTTLFVEDKPFLILGGELHNSSGSDLTYMEDHVWPGLRKLGGNCYLTPVYWECMETERGIYDFSLVDGVKSIKGNTAHKVACPSTGESNCPAFRKTGGSYFLS